MRECSPSTLRLRWLLAGLDGALFGWILFVIYIAALNLNQAAEFFWHPRPANLLPRLTIWVQNAMPDERWALLTCWVSSSIGFGLISQASNEALSGRVFRWVMSAGMTILLALSIPIMAQFKNLSGGPDSIVWDEVLFAALGLCMLICGIMRARSACAPS
jgi:hypothetical protein